MTWLQAVLLGAVQGLTEFLPVSSDGHLALFQAAMPHSEASLALDIALHLGTLGSMLLFFRKDLLRLLKGLVSREASPERDLDRRRVAYILIVTVFTGAVGLGLKPFVEKYVASYGAAGVGFLISAVFLFGGSMAFGRAQKTMEQIPWWHLVVLGLVQGGAVWPGWSRSGSTIAAALMLGWRWEEAGRFSFLMAIPAIAGATLLTFNDITALDPVPALTGGVAAFVVGCLSLSILMKFLASKRLWPFAVYCVLAGLYALTR